MVVVIENPVGHFAEMPMMKDGIVLYCTKNGAVAFVRLFTIVRFVEKTKADGFVDDRK